MLVGVVAVCRLCCGVVFRKHRGETMKSFGVLATLISAAALAGMTGTASAQTQGSTAQHVQLQKTIGQAKPDIVPSLIVMNSRGATLQGGKLVLTGMSPNSIIFADRPVRSAGHDLTSRIIEDWGIGADNFAKDPPNATVSGFSKDGSGIRDAVVVLKSPKLEGDKLTFDVDVLEGDLNGADGPASIFIDLIGRPFTPLSFAGVARRIGLSRRLLCRRGNGWRSGRRRGCGRCRCCLRGSLRGALWLCTPAACLLCATLRLLPAAALLLTNMIWNAPFAGRGRSALRDNIAGRHVAIASALIGFSAATMNGPGRHRHEKTSDHCNGFELDRLGDGVRVRAGHVGRSRIARRHDGDRRQAASATRSEIRRRDQG